MLNKLLIKFIKNCLLVMSFFLLVSCSLMSPVKITTPTTYVINKVPAVYSTHPSCSATLVVTHMEAEAAYDTSDMIYMKEPYRISYYVKNRWVKEPTRMIEPLIIQTLHKTKFLNAVLTPESIGGYDYILNTRLIQLYQEYCPYSNVVRLKIQAEIVDALTYEVIASKQFNIEEPVPGKYPYCNVVATNRAVARFLQQLTYFCIQHIKDADNAN